MARKMSTEEIKVAADRAEAGPEATAAKREAAAAKARAKLDEDDADDGARGKTGRKPEPPPRTATMDDFYAYLPEHKYIYTPTRSLWPATTINSIMGNGASVALDRTKPCQQMTWCPGKPMIVKDRLVIDGGWTDKKGSQTFNLYLPPVPIAGDSDKAGPWRQHGEKLFGEDHVHIEKWLAWKVQHPDIKINHGLVLGSHTQGIGKDSYLAPVKRAVGPWNFKDVGARQSMHPDFNPFLKTSILRINEAHDLGEKRFSFYDHSKDWMAAPPETLRVADKYIGGYPIFNLVGVIITTNHKSDGLYLPREDRRHFVCWTQVRPEDFEDGYWNELWNWYDGGGIEHAAAYLATLDLTDFDPFSPPRKTDAFWAIVNANQSQEDSDLASLLDTRGQDPLGESDLIEWPDAVTIEQLTRWAARENATSDLWAWLDDRKNRRAIPHRLERCGYVPVRNPDAEDGLWRFNGKRQAIYAMSKLTDRERLAAAKRLIRFAAWRAAWRAKKARRRAQPRQSQPWE